MIDLQTQMLGKHDQMLGKQDRTIDKQVDVGQNIVGEIRYSTDAIVSEILSVEFRQTDIEDREF
jgi:hypothetical protein